MQGILGTDQRWPNESGFGLGPGEGRARGGNQPASPATHQHKQAPLSDDRLNHDNLPPIFARFATAPPSVNPPTLVAIIPRPLLPPSDSLTSESETRSAQPAHKPKRLSLMHRAPSPTIVTTPSPSTDAHPAEVDDQPSDGPLFRALIGSLERRAQSLRASTKVLIKSLEGSLSALQANHAAQSGVDDALEGLSQASSGTLKSPVLGGLYATTLGPHRDVATRARQQEIDHLDELLNRLRASSERLKTQEQRRKEFETISKRYYDEISKYLSRADTEQSKTASLDNKQAIRADDFNAARLDYCGWLEGLVEAEEGAVASWLRSWAGVPDVVEDVVMSEHIRRTNREQQQRTLTHSLRASIALPQQWTDSSEGHGLDDGDVSDSGVFSDGGLSAYSANSGGGGGAGQAQPKLSNRRQHRSSIPADFHYREPGTRDKIKNFVRNAQTSIASAMPSSHPTPLSPTLGARSPTLSSGPFSPPAASQARVPSPTSLQPPSAASSTAKQQLASAQRKKEGFLLAKSKARGTTEFKSADSGGHWHKYWVVLTDSIAEFSGWKDGLKMRANPISLKAACVKMARGSDRRFVFEVITPTTRRTYQALSEADRDAWVAAINKSIESLLNGTSTVRGFDSSKLTGTSTPYSLQSFGSTTSLGIFSSGDNPTSPTSSALGNFSNRLPNWMAPPLVRRASLGANRRSKHLSSPPAESAPRLTIGDYGQELASPAGLGLGLPAPRRGHRSTASEGGWRAFSGASATSGVSAASGSSAGGDYMFVPSGRPRSISSENADSEENGIGPSDVESSVGEHGREILEGVNRLVVCPPPESLAEGKARRAREVVALAEQPGNTTCADCGAPDPKWASWNLGVFLCIRCSGVHRSLGTHISKVRSVELDDWNEEQLAGLAIGNERANVHWLGRQPTIEPSDAIIGDYIKRKYNGEWVADTTPLASPPGLPAIPESPIATRIRLPVA